jgi:integrase
VRRDEMWSMLAALPADARGVRDRALLLVGFGGALRRSELVALDVEDIEFSDRGLTLNIRRSKTDQEARGCKVGVPKGRAESTCAATALKQWIEFAGITSGPIFRNINRHGTVGLSRLTAQSVALIVKERCLKARLECSAY